MPPETIDRLLQDHARGVAGAAEAARELFEAAAADAEVESRWLELAGDDAIALTNCARRYDLTVLPPVARTSFGIARTSAADIGLAAGEPVMVIPDAGPAGGVGERILVAWKGARGIRRARCTTPGRCWPRRRRSMCWSWPTKARGGPEGLLQRHLERHDCKPNIVVDRSADASAADIIRRQVTALSADLLVMGLYGLARLSGVRARRCRRDLLTAPPVPLFLSH